MSLARCILARETAKRSEAEVELVLVVLLRMLSTPEAAKKTVELRERHERSCRQIDGNSNPHCCGFV